MVDDRWRSEWQADAQPKAQRGQTGEASPCRHSPVDNALDSHFGQWARSATRFHPAKRPRPPRKSPEFPPYLTPYSMPALTADAASTRHSCDEELALAGANHLTSFSNCWDVGTELIRGSSQACMWPVGCQCHSLLSTAGRPQSHFCAPARQRFRLHFKCPTRFSFRAESPRSKLIAGPRQDTTVRELPLR